MGSTVYAAPLVTTTWPFHSTLKGGGSVLQGAGHIPQTVVGGAASI
jgi:hypothetical protein